MGFGLGSGFKESSQISHMITRIPYFSDVLKLIILTICDLEQTERVSNQVLNFNNIEIGNAEIVIYFWVVILGSGVEMQQRNS